MRRASAADPSADAARARATPTTRPATLADEQKLYDVAPSFVDRLPWAEFLEDSQCVLFDDARSVAAFFELQAIGTEGRDAAWLEQARDALENALQDSFDELEEQPWVVQFYVQDETSFDEYLRSLHAYIHPRARETAFTRFYLRLIEHHLRAVARPGGFFRDNAVTHLPWRGRTRRVRMVICRRADESTTRRSLSAEEALNAACDRAVRGLSNAGVHAQRLSAVQTHAWLLRWFNPRPTHLGDSPEAIDRFYALAAHPGPSGTEKTLALAGGTDFAQTLFFHAPRSDAQAGVWYFDDEPHRVVVLDRLRTPPGIGHITGETRAGGDAVNALFDRMPEGTIMCLTLIITPQDALEAHLNFLARKSIGETLASEQARKDVQEARSLIGSSHKLYRGAVAFYVRGADLSELEDRSRQLANVLLSAGLQPVRDEDEVAPLNSYLRWLPGVYDPARDRRQWYTQLIFAQHVAHLCPAWGRARGTGNPGLTFFNRGGGLITADPLNRHDRQMNAHLLLLGPTGSGKSASLNSLLNQVTAIYRPRLFIVEAGNSFGLFGQFAERLGLSVHRVKLSPGAGVTLAPFADARLLIVAPERVQTLDVDALDEATSMPSEHDRRDVLGELEITARLMITGGEEKEEARMTRADRGLIRQCLLDAARTCVELNRVVLTRDVRDALRRRGEDVHLAEPRRVRMAEMADAMDLFCQGANGELFDRPGTPWPEADITIVDLAMFAREGYNAELSISYISLINAVNYIAERDQFFGRPIINVTDEGHLIMKNPLLAPYVVKITKMWRKLGAWFWLATQNLDDFPEAAKVLLSMIEWWFCLSMPPDEVEKVARFRELTPAQRALMLSARKESGKFSEGIMLSKSNELLFRAVLPSLNLALAMTEADEKAERFELMKRHSIGELDAALMISDEIDRRRGMEPLSRDAYF